MPVSSQSCRKGARTRAVELAAKIPHNTTNLRLAMQREAFSRGLTLPDVAARMDFGGHYVKKLLCSNERRIPPGVVENFIKHVKVSPARARRLRRLGAIHAGWNIELED